MKTNLLVFTFSILALITKGQALRDSLIASPNIFSQGTLVSYTIGTNDTISISIFNSFGMSIIALRTDFIFSAGVYQDSLIMDNFPDGIYLISMKNNQKNLKSAKIIKAVGTNITKILSGSIVNTYPNPVKDILNIDFEKNNFQNSNLQITNTLGKTLYSLSNPNQKQEIDLRFLASGIYYLKIESDEGNRVFKVVKE